MERFLHEEKTLSTKKLIDKNIVWYNISDMSDDKKTLIAEMEEEIRSTVIAFGFKGISTVHPLLSFAAAHAAGVDPRNPTTELYEYITMLGDDEWTVENCDTVKRMVKSNLYYKYNCIPVATQNTFIHKLLPYLYPTHKAADIIRTLPRHNVNLSEEQISAIFKSIDA